jgi:hypothetical protein
MGNKVPPIIVVDKDEVYKAQEAEKQRKEKIDALRNGKS